MRFFGVPLDAQAWHTEPPCRPPFPWSLSAHLRCHLFQTGFSAADWIPGDPSRKAQNIHPGTDDLQVPCHRLAVLIMPKSGISCCFLKSI